METLIPYFLSAITIYMFLLAGNKNKYAWIVGLFNQLLWLIWIMIIQAWGLIPMNIALWFVYYRNYTKWDNKKVSSPDIPIYCKKCGKHYADKYKESKKVEGDDGICFSCFRKKNNY